MVISCLPNTSTVIHFPFNIHICARNAKEIGIIDKEHCWATSNAFRVTCSKQTDDWRGGGGPYGLIESHVIYL